MGDPNADRIKALRAKLAALRERDRTCALGAAPWHRYESIRVTADDVRVAEARLGYSLPDQYRDWLLEVGYGVGPDFGLLPIVAERCFQVPTFRPSGGTMLHRQPAILDLSVDDGPHAIGQIADVSELTPEGCAERISRNDPFITVQSARGVLAICEADYDSFCGIVAVGPMRGAIVAWLLDYRHDCGAGLLFISFDYLTWIESWLDRSLNELAKRGR